ncbi:MAG: 4-hydroxybenzoate polyprenyltransferase [Candidatus Paceibacteria bacterium]|jgi:4-hydroxybenzoate polyprenyltransferase
MKIKRLINISRPRFWIYVLGTFLLGVIAAGDPRLLERETLIILGVLFWFFTYPANLMIYGVNDIYDYETDKHNPKKIEYEELVEPKDQKALWGNIALWVIPFFVVLFWLNWQASIVFLIFNFTSVYYSATPIRGKANPPLDIIFSSLIYISPVVLGFFATGNTNISWLGIAGGLSWASAMQTYSAVPDIESDTKGGVNTLATVLGKNRALWFCFIAYALATYIGYQHLGWIPLVLGLMYLVIVVVAIMRPEETFWMYKKFPLVNTAFGMVLFFLLLFKFL